VRRRAGTFLAHAANDGAVGTVILAAVLPTGPLAPPQLTVDPAGPPGQAVLSWTPSPGANGYYVYLRNVTNQETTFTKLPYPLFPGRDPWTAGLLTTGDTYAFQLQACKGAGCGTFSNVAIVTAP
jgi:hypothetical protein